LIGAILGGIWLTARPVSNGEAVEGETEAIKETPLAKVVEDSLEGTTGTYSAVIKHFGTGETYRRDSSRVYYKLWVMATAYQEIEAGRLVKDKTLSATIQSLNQFFEIPPEAAELNSGGISLTVESAIGQMIAISHNYAAMLLTRELTVGRIQEEVGQLGLRNTTVGGETKTTPDDVATFLEQLYRGEVVSASASAEMLEVMRKQEKDEVIPRDLPPGLSVAHKTGEIDWVKHDAGIVFTPQGDYLIVLFSESNLPAGAADRMARLSRAVYDYFTVN
jgi:beta-lactamase class A